MVNPNIKIIPRLTFEKGNYDMYDRFFHNSDRFIRILLRRIQHNRLDGILLEMNFAFLHDKFYENFLAFVARLSEALKSESKQLIITLYPKIKGSRVKINKTRLTELSPYVDYFFLMTYNYNMTNTQTKEEIPYLAPYSWIKETIKSYSADDLAIKRKFIMVNF